MASSVLCCFVRVAKGKRFNDKFPTAIDVDDMAYLRKEKEIVEMDYPIEKVWLAISESITSLEWKIEEIEEANHRVKAKTKQTILAYGSTLSIEAASVNEKTTRISVSAETPTTTVTALLDFGRTRERIDSFLATLVRQLGLKDIVSNKTE
jgi:hypothetical protein